ncbi:hypothetical protein PV04_09848 [Phialophora macrospora]|uniref:Protein-S-isoprenylcysteine O-methyltransferase n=1 Tax=Phialophora macrospora TaxID=1851006 RepID=A0A0D2FSF0_9EURO|nr:hypothetical protein PV04_09848 [Phialophora macrospora]
MPGSALVSRASFATAILVSTIGTFIALSPPNPDVDHESSVGDSLTSLGLTGSLFGKLALSPLFLLSLHTAILALYNNDDPDAPASLLRHGRTNGLNADLLRWSPSTIIPLSIILLLGVPLRLVPFATLGHNFTFFLSSPDRLITTGVYAHVQHPSYVGIVALVLANVMLLGRTDGVMSCWTPPARYDKLQGLTKWVLWPAVLSTLLFALWTRVMEEEMLLDREFGREWKTWHDQTARFIPGLF